MVRGGGGNHTLLKSDESWDVMLVWDEVKA